MPRIVYREAPFSRISSFSWYERDFERLVLSRASHIFPRWTAIPFYADIVAPGGETKRPDLALIDRHYREWWVVEVELQHHSLEGHVLPQVDVFVEGRYTERHADWIADRHPELERGRLRAMMLGDSPNVLVVVDSPSTSWRGVLEEHGVALSVVEPFADAQGDVLLRVNGVEPEPPGAVLSRCVRSASLARMWSVQSPAALPIYDSEVGLSITFEGVPSDWVLVQLHDSVMLRARRGNPLADLSSVDLVLRDDLSLEFVASSTRQRSRK